LITNSAQQLMQPAALHYYTLEEVCFSQTMQTSLMIVLHQDNV